MYLRVFKQPGIWLASLILLWLSLYIYESSFTMHIKGSPTPLCTQYAPVYQSNRIHLVSWDLIEESMRLTARKETPSSSMPLPFLHSFFQSSFALKTPVDQESAQRSALPAFLFTFQGVSPDLKADLNRHLALAKKEGCWLYIPSWTHSTWSQWITRQLDQWGWTFVSSRPLINQGLWIWSSHRFTLDHVHALTPIADRILTRPFQRIPLVAHLRFPILSSTSPKDFHFYAVHLPESPRKQRAALLSLHQITPLFDSLDSSDPWIISGGWWNRLPLSSVPHPTGHHFTRLSFDPLLKTTFFFPVPTPSPSLRSWTLDQSRLKNQTTLLDFWIGSSGTWTDFDFKELDLIPPHWVGQRKGVGAIWDPVLKQ
jgi:hypothetical protein